MHTRLLLAVLCLLIQNNGYCQLTICDRDGNTYPVKKFPDDHLWMTVNLSVKMPDSYCYENKVENCAAYGRLYNWMSAQAGCSLLGDGWRLPTNEEWQRMVKFYGGVRDASKDTGRAAYKALFTGGNSGFNVVYGGGRDEREDKYFRVNQHGFYWTASATDSTHAWFYNFGDGMKIVNRHSDGEKGMYISVRCIR